MIQSTSLSGTIAVRRLHAAITHTGDMNRRCLPRWPMVIEIAKHAQHAEGRRCRAFACTVHFGVSARRCRVSLSAPVRVKIAKHREACKDESPKYSNWPNLQAPTYRVVYLQQWTGQNHIAVRRARRLPAAIASPSILWIAHFDDVSHRSKQHDEGVGVLPTRRSRQYESPVLVIGQEETSMSTDFRKEGGFDLDLVCAQKSLVIASPGGSVRAA